MDRITNRIIPYRKAKEYLFCGEDYLDIYKRSNGKLQRAKRLEGFNLLEAEDPEIRQLEKFLSQREIGLVLNAQHFIYNIFEFEKIPFKLSLRKEAVEWRLKKVFPENIENYIHEYFLLNRKFVLSVLFSRKVMDRIEHMADIMKKDIIDIGNSTVEMMNRVLNRQMWNIFKGFPDILIEIDRDLFVIVAQDSSVPFYLRKFRCPDYARNTQTVLKNIDFLQSNYARKLKNYFLISNDPDHLLEVIDRELQKRELTKWGTGKNRNCFWLK
jgi:hypothetical protein